MTLEELKKQIAEDEQMQSNFMEACEDDNLSSFLDIENYKATASDIEDLTSFFKDLKDNKKIDDVDDAIEVGKDTLNWLEKIIDFFKKLFKK